MIAKLETPKNALMSYRPISFLPTISKIAERVILTRLKEEMDRLDFIPQHQLGFRKSHFPSQQLVRLTEHITGKINISTPTELVYKMRRANISRSLISIIQSYLAHRKFHVRIEDTASTTRPIQAGVPEGFILGPHLFNLYMADIPITVHSQLAQFADDTAIYISNHNKKFLTNQLQEDIETMSSYFRTRRININPAKSIAVFFQNSKKHNQPDPISVEGRIILWGKEAKYLGITLDETFTFKRYEKSTQEKSGTKSTQPQKKKFKLRSTRILRRAVQIPRNSWPLKCFSRNYTDPRQTHCRKIIQHLPENGHSRQFHCQRGNSIQSAESQTTGHCATQTQS